MEAGNDCDPQLKIVGQLGADAGGRMGSRRRTRQACTRCRRRGRMDAWIATGDSGSSQSPAQINM